MYVRVCMCLYVCMYVCIYVCMYVHVCVHVCMYVSEFLISFEAWAKLAPKWLVCAPLETHFETKS